MRMPHAFSWTSVVSVLTVTMLSPVAAHGATTATVAVSHSHVEPGCSDYDIEYDLNLPAGVTSWEAKISGKGSRVRLASRYYERPEGWTTLEWCNFDFKKSREVTVNVTGAYIDSAGVRQSITGSQTVTLKPARTRVRFSASTTTPRHGQAIRFSAKVEAYSKRGGYFLPVEYVDLDVEARVRGRWREIDSVYFSTNENGYDSYRGRWVNRGVYTLRAVLPAQAGYSKFVSSPLTIRTR